jgi:hypothetical protein
LGNWFPTVREFYVTHEVRFCLTAAGSRAPPTCAASAYASAFGNPPRAAAVHPAAIATATATSLSCSRHSRRAPASILAPVALFI